MDYRQQLTVYGKQIELEKKQKIEIQLLIAEAINFAYVGSQPPVKKGQRPQGEKAYTNWREHKMSILYPERKKTKPSIWKMIKKKKKGIIKIN